MTPKKLTDRAEVEKLLQRQRPPTAGEPLPSMPDDLRHEWQAHFTPRSRTFFQRPWVWAGGLAAAATIVICLTRLDLVTPSPIPPPRHSVRNELLNLRGLPTGSSPSESMSPATIALLHYQDPATAGLYVRGD